MNAKRYDILLKLTARYKIYLNDDQVVVENELGHPLAVRINDNGVRQYSMYYNKHRVFYGAHELKAFLQGKPVINVLIPVKDKVIKGTVCKICGLTYPRSEMRVNGMCYLCHNESKRVD